MANSRHAWEGMSHTQVIAMVTMEGKRLEWPDSAHPAIAVSCLTGRLPTMRNSRTAEWQVVKSVVVILPFKLHTLPAG